MIPLLINYQQIKQPIGIRWAVFFNLIQSVFVIFRLCRFGTPLKVFLLQFQFCFFLCMNLRNDDRVGKGGNRDDEQDDCHRSLDESDRTCDHQGLDIVGFDELSEDKTENKR